MDLSREFYHFKKKISAKINKIVFGFFGKRHIEWFVETLRDVGVSVLTGVVLGWVVGELRVIWVVILLLAVALLWYISIISIYLIKDKDA
jgi:hypothetical protein